MRLSPAERTLHNFPTTAGAFRPFSAASVDAFVFELASSGSALTYSTLSAGSGNDEATGVADRQRGKPYIVGSASVGFPQTAALIQSTIPGASNGFVTKLNTSSGNALAYSTYLGAARALTSRSRLP